MDKEPSESDVSATANEKGFSIVSQAYADIEFTLQQIEGAVTYYQLLGLPRRATAEQVASAHRAISERLNPTCYGLEGTMPDLVAARIDGALLRIKRAYEVLSETGTRLKYDLSLRESAVSPTGLPLGINAAKAPTLRPGFEAVPAGAPPESDSDANRTARIVRGQQAAHTRPITETKTTDRRRLSRTPLSIPAKVVGYANKDGKWQEIAQTRNLDRFGVGLILRHRVRRGSVLYLTMQMPTKLRTHAYHEPFYNVYAIVRRVNPGKNGERLVGLEFLGPSPPPGHLERPWAHLRLETWSGPDRRKRNRMLQVEVALIEFLDDTMKTVAKQMCKTEDISPDGAKVCLTGLPMDVDYVRLTCKRIGFKSTAIIRDMYKGKDGLARICLEFIRE